MENKICTEHVACINSCFLLASRTWLEKLFFESTVLRTLFTAANRYTAEGWDGQGLKDFRVVLEIRNQQNSVTLMIPTVRILKSEQRSALLLNFSAMEDIPRNKANFKTKSTAFSSIEGLSYGVLIEILSQENVYRGVGPPGEGISRGGYSFMTCYV